MKCQIEAGQADANAHSMPVKADGAAQSFFNRDACIDAAETTADGACCALTFSGLG